MEIQWSRFPTDERWPEMRPILERMLSRNPEDRYATTNEVTSALRALLPTGDVIDVETLSDQLGKMDLKVSRSWENLADDLDLDAPSGVDELMMNLSLPAGERVADDFDEDMTQVSQSSPGSPDATVVTPPHGGSAAAEEETSPKRPAGALMSPAGARTAGPVSVDFPEPTDRLPAFPSGTFAAPDRIDAHAEPTRPPKGPEDTRPPGPIAQAPPPAALPTPGGKADPRPPVPLEEIVESVERVRPPLDETKDLGTARIERQLVRMREELAASRQAAANLRTSRTSWRIMFAGALLVGLVAGFFVRPQGNLEPSLVLLPPADTAVGPAKFRHDPTRSISPQDRRDAAEMLEAAQERLAKRDLDGAERLLGLCIEVADLPACHKTIATMLTITGDHGRARSHYEHFLDTAPSDPDAARIRDVLRE
jgi:hypothetical protein